MQSSKGLKNIKWGLIAQIVTIGLGIFIPRLVLVNLGSEANGLMSSVSSVLSYMSLLEAGVGLATIQALYTPIANQDRTYVNAIMAATNKFYLRTGRIYLLIVICLSVGYTAFVKTSISKISVFAVVILAGLSGVLNYFFQGKYKLLMAAEGKNYITTNITMIATVCTSIVKVIVLLLGGSVVILQSVYFIINLFQVCIYYQYIKRNYSWLDLSVTPDYEGIGQKNAVLVHQVSELLFNNTDIVVLTIFTSLKVVSVYSMYAMIFGMVKAVSTVFSDSYLYAVGQSYGDKAKFNKVFNAYEVYNMSITFAGFCVATILMPNFLKLYTRDVTDINYIDSKVLILFTAFYLLQNGRKASQTVINIAQHFEQTKWRAALESIINIGVSIVLTAKIGIYGVLLGTIAALLYRTNDVIIYASKLMHRSPWISYRRWLCNLGVFVCLYRLHMYFDIQIKSWPQMVSFGVIVSLIVFLIFLLIDSLLNRDVASYVYQVIKQGMKKKR